VENCETGADSGNKGTGEFDSAKWSSDKPMASDVTVPDTCAESHIGDTAAEAGAAANQAAATKSPNMMNWPARASFIQLP